jgi:hypothetical protein
MNPLTYLEIPQKARERLEEQIDSELVFAWISPSVADQYRKLAVIARYELEEAQTILDETDRKLAAANKQLDQYREAVNEGLKWTKCTCDEAWTKRGLHESNAPHELVEEAMFCLRSLTEEGK